MHPEHHVTDPQRTYALWKVGGLSQGHQLVVQRPVVGAQRGMQVEPEGLGSAKYASNNLVVDGQ